MKTIEDYIHAQKVFEEFKLTNLGEYHDLYVQSDTSMLSHVLENFWNKYIEIYKLDSAPFFICSRIGMASLFKKDRSEITIINK